MPDRLFTNGNLILPDRLLDGFVFISGNRIHDAGSGPGPIKQFAGEVIDLGGNYLSPGFVDLHVHGGAGADFMDATAEAFRAVCQVHLRHGTTSLLPTSTVASHKQIVAFLQQCRRFQHEDTGGAKVLGAHFYGPYFAEQARGCHPQAPIRPPVEKEIAEFLAFADCIRTATVAPELPGAKEFVEACVAHGIRCNAGHSHATFAQMEEAVRWGVRHVDHLFCAMSDRARLRQTQTYPMRGGVLEATLFFDELTTEVIADGKHLQAELLKLAYKIKGPDRLTLVTDCNRALDMPDGQYIFGPLDGGERIIRRDGVGLMPDGSALASGVMGMDHMVRTFHRLTGVPLVETIRMATLTPARIAGVDGEVGSIEFGKRADFVVLDRELNVRAVYRDGDQHSLSPWGRASG
jgi:N-acetylglucosamine-6-phosphate deacetylase